ncbi:hypothetical protein VTK56DRAFT_6141 [Thermocarpiscus australiensis]
MAEPPCVNACIQGSGTAASMRLSSCRTSCSARKRRIEGLTAPNLKIITIWAFHQRRANAQTTRRRGVEGSQAAGSCNKNEGINIKSPGIYLRKMNAGERPFEVHYMADCFVPGISALLILTSGSPMRSSTDLHAPCAVKGHVWRCRAETV